MVYVLSFLALAGTWVAAYLTIKHAVAQGIALAVSWLAGRGRSAGAVQLRQDADEALARYRMGRFSEQDRDR